MKELGSHITGEFSRLKIDINENYGLSAPVAVNALTGVMHRIDGASLICHSCEYANPEIQPFGAYAIIRSLPAIAYRACRNCETKLKPNKQ